MNKLSERELPDDYPVYAGYFYVINDKPIMATRQGTIAMLKQEYKVDVVKSCDIIGRQSIQINKNNHE